MRGSDHTHLHDRARRRGVHPVVYWLARGVLQPAFHCYLRMRRCGREHIPRSGPVILAGNHRSFLDPFVIGMMTRRPLYYVAKRELFAHPVVAWWLSALGAFPVRRGTGDADMFATARAILARGDAVLIFPEGTRRRPGPLGRPRRGVGRLALETGAPVVPVAIAGTDDVRRGWRLRPRRVRVRAGRPIAVSRAEPTPERAAAVTDRIWGSVALQWEWLGGMPPLRRAAVVGEHGAGLAAALARAGLAVDAIEDPAAAPLPPSRHDLVCFATDAAAVPAAVARHAGAIAPRAGVLVACEGLVPPFGTLPAAFVSERVGARAVAALAVTDGGLVVSAPDAAFARQAADALAAGGAHARAAARAADDAATARPKVLAPA